MSNENDERSRLDGAALEPANMSLGEAIDKNWTNLPPELFRKIYTFSNLQDALRLRSTCRQLQGSLDAFRYTSLYSLTSPLPKYRSRAALCSFVRLQDAALTFMSTENLSVLRTLLRNETATVERLETIQHVFFQLDEGDACRILLEDGRCLVTMSDLKEALIRGRDSVAAALKEDERIRPFIQMCHECGTKIGIDSCDHCEVTSRGNGAGRKRACLPLFCISCLGLPCTACFMSYCPSCVRNAPSLPVRSSCSMCGHCSH